MKIIAVGDIHGRDTWKKVAAQEPDFDKFVFVGDYFDNWHPMTPERIFENFREMLAFQDKHPGKVVLCIGNHDFQYMPISGGTERYSGYNPITQLNLDGFPDWWKTLVPAYQYQDILFSHAGLTQTWAENNLPQKVIRFWMTQDLDKRIADRFEYAPESFKFHPEDESNCGEDIRQGPFWVRPIHLSSNPYPGIRQVVGHTHTEGVDNIGPVTMIDTGKGGQYLKIIDGVMHTGSL